MSHNEPDIVLVSADAPGVAEIPPNPAVGRIYEIGINGQGLMLADTPQDPQTLPALVVPSLEAPRLATTDTPFSQAVERYTFEAFHDWTAGAGQRFLNREESTSKAFWDSEGVDPFTVKGELSLLPSTTKTLSDTYAGIRLVVVGNDLYALTADNELTRHNGTAWQSPVTITDGDAIVISGMTSDGQFWYAATGEGIVRGTTTNPAANWSTQIATDVRWSAGRICAAVIASGSTPNRFTTLSVAGAEEKASGHLTLDAGHTIVLGGAAAGHFYFGSFVGDQGQIWAWQLGVDTEGAFLLPYVAWDMPQGIVPTSITTAGDEVWVRAYRPEGPSAGQVTIYRCVPGSGLTPFSVAELGVDNLVGDFAEVGDNVLFSWVDTTGDAALGAVNLKSGGYARWLLGHDPGLVRSIVEWRGVEAFTIAGQGVYVRNLDAYETTGWVIQSTFDGASVLDKVLDALTLEAKPLSGGESVTIEYALDGQSFQEAGVLDTPGAQRQLMTPGERSGTFTIREELGGNGTSKTIMYATQAKYHPLGLKDSIVVVRVKCYDELTGLNGAPLKENGKGVGVRNMRLMESHGQSRILYQDIDWHLTGIADVWEVVSVKIERTGIYDKQVGENRIGGVAELTLRKSWA